MRRKAFHVVLGLVLVGCLICPFVELAIGWNDTILSTGYDTESALAVVMLLVELVLGLAGVIAFFLPHVHATEPLVIPRRISTSAFGIGTLPPDLSPPVPLRI